MIISISIFCFLSISLSSLVYSYSLSKDSHSEFFGPYCIDSARTSNPRCEGCSRYELLHKWYDSNAESIGECDTKDRANKSGFSHEYFRNNFGGCMSTRFPPDTELKKAIGEYVSRRTARKSVGSAKRRSLKIVSVGCNIGAVLAKDVDRISNK